jgi:hypothetical protein
LKRKNAYKRGVITVIKPSGGNSERNEEFFMIYLAQIKAADDFCN